jgi:hypothetical protein
MCIDAGDELGCRRTMPRIPSTAESATFGKPGYFPETQRVGEQSGTGAIHRIRLSDDFPSLRSSPAGRGGFLPQFREGSYVRIYRTVVGQNRANGCCFPLPAGEGSRVGENGATIPNAPCVDLLKSEKLNPRWKDSVFGRLSLTPVLPLGEAESSTGLGADELFKDWCEAGIDGYAGAA